MENSSSEETANASYEYNYEYDEVCDKKNVARVGSIVVPLVFSFVVLFSLVGNILVLVFLPHSLHSLMRRLLCNLAISDLIFTAGLPFWSCQFIWGWMFGDIMCKGVSFVFSVGFYSSIVFLVLISFWRYLVIVYPLKGLQPKYRATSNFLAWVISIALAVPALLQSSVVSDTDDSKKLYCMHNSNGAKLAATYQQNIFFVVAFLLIVFCKISICQKIYLIKSYNRVPAYRFILCIVMFFFIGWAPYNIVIFLQSRSYYHINDFTDCNMSDNLDYALYVCTMLAFSHCCLNPVIYVFTRETLWKHFREILTCTKIPADAQQPQIAELNDD